jgi:F-type H+-transporting ATPase subunit alpha
VVLSVTDGIVTILGLKFVKAGELVMFSRNITGMVLNLNSNLCSAVIFGSDSSVTANSRCKQSYNIVSIPVSDSYLGRVVDALGYPIDGKGPIPSTQRYLVDIKAPGIVPRSQVNEPLQTGILAIDSMVPVGRGQRELIIGDRQTGKTAIAIDTILNQKADHLFASN